MNYTSLKFLPPRAATSWLPREALLTRLANPEAGRIVLIHGPAGYGKTTLMLQFLEQARNVGRSTAWLSLDKSDNDVSRFLDLITEAGLQAQGKPPVRPEPLPGEATTTRGSWDRVLRTFADDEFPELLFIDEFETISDTTVLQTLSAALHHLRPGQQVVIASRVLPELPLSRLRLDGAVLELGPRDLQFTVDECSALIAEQLPTPFSKSDIRFLYEQTDGWPAAMLLTVLILRNNPDIDQIKEPDEGSRKVLDEYFLENVFNRKTADEQHFLLCTAILREFNKGLCTAVSGRADAGDVLARLLLDSFIVQSGHGSNVWYRYHALFSGFLQRLLTSDYADLAEDLHRKAADWLIKNNRPDDAINHALQASDQELAASMMSKQAIDLFAKLRFNRIQQWTSRIDDEVVFRHPNLLVAKIWSDVFFRNRSSYEISMRAINLLDEQGRITPQLRSLISMARVIFKFTYSGYREVLELCRLELERLPVSAPEYVSVSLYNSLGYAHAVLGEFEVARIDFMNAYARAQGATQQVYEGQPLSISPFTYSTHAIAEFLQGNITHAHEITQAALAVFAKPRFSGALVQHALVPPHAAWLYETNRIDECINVLTDSLAVIRQYALPDWLQLAYVVLARAHLAQDNKKEAIRLLEELERQGYADELPHTVATARWEMVRLHQLSGDLNRAEEIALGIRGENLSAAIEGHCLFPADIEADEITALRLMIGNGEAEQSLQHIADLQKKTATARGYRHLKLHILKAIAYDTLNENRHAIRCMSKAVSNAEPEAYVRSFIDEGPHALRLLAEIRQSLSPTGADKNKLEYLDQLLTAGGYTKGSTEALADTLIEPLTARERELLQLISDGHANKTIAIQLGLTENTVKWHLSNLYSKLNVKKRTQAVSRGRRLGLVE